MKNTSPVITLHVPVDGSDRDQVRAAAVRAFEKLDRTGCVWIMMESDSKGFKLKAITHRWRTRRELLAFMRPLAGKTGTIEEMK